jgi:hypothetical protein
MISATVKIITVKTLIPIIVLFFFFWYLFCFFSHALALWLLSWHVSAQGIEFSCYFIHNLG